MVTVCQKWRPQVLYKEHEFVVVYKTICSTTQWHSHHINHSKVWKSLLKSNEKKSTFEQSNRHKISQTDVNSLTFVCCIIVHYTKLANINMQFNNMLVV